MKISVSFIRSYLTNSYQQTEIGSFFSDCNKIITGVPQDSKLGPLFFNISIDNLFLFEKNLKFATMPMITLSTLLIKTLVKS